MKEMKDIMFRLAALAAQSGEDVSDFRLKFTAESVYALGPDDACVAIEKLLASSRRFPTVAEIKAAMGLSDPTARDTGLHSANMLLQAMAKFGSADGNQKHGAALKLALGELWEVVERMGGWNFCIERATENVSHFVSQTRDLVESYSATGVIDAKKIPKTLMPRHDAFQLAEKEQVSISENKTDAVLKLTADILRM